MKNTIIFLALLALMGAVAAEPVIIEYQASKMTVSGNQIQVQLFLKNTGTAMTENWIVEMQPRPQGQLPLSVTGQDVCDATIPTNVHVGFMLAAGEQGVVTLTANMPPGTYDVYILGRTKCYATPPIGTTTIGPWGNYELKFPSVAVLGGNPVDMDWTTMAGIGIIVVVAFLYFGGKR